MELKNALENILTINDVIAEEELVVIKADYDEAKEILLKRVSHVFNILDNEEELESYKGHIYPLYLLAEFQEKEAFELIVKILELDEKYTNHLLMDILTEDYASILASVATRFDVERIKVVIENNKLPLFNRMAAVVALITMYAEGDLAYEELSSYFLFLIETQTNYEFVTQLAYECAVLNISDSFEIIEKYYNENKMDLEALPENEFKEIIKNANNNDVLENLKNDFHTQYIVDTADAVSWFGIFSKPEPIRSEKIGRNDPCPCGSGKKYKKCCGK